MSIRLIYSQNDRSIRTASFFRVDYSPAYWNAEGWPWTVYNQDLLLGCLRSQYFYCPGPTRSIASLFGFIGSTATEYVQFSREPYLPSKDRHDERNYGSFYRNLQLFGSSLTGRSFIAPSSEREHEVRHPNFSGTLATSQTLIPTYREDFNFYGSTIKVRNLHGNIIDYCRLNSTEPFDFTLLHSSYPSLPTYNVLDILDYIRQQDTFESFVFFGAFSIHRIISRLNYSIDIDRLRITYHMHALNEELGMTHYDWDSEIVVPFHLPQPQRSPIAGSVVPVFGYSDTTFSFKNAFTLNPEPPGSLPIGRSSDYWYGGLSYNSPFPISDISAIASDEKSVVTALNVHPYLDHLLNLFRDEIDKRYRDIATASLFSTVDAFQQAEGYLGTNILQNLAKIPDIAGMLPQITEAIKIMGKIAKKDWSLLTLKEILALAASTNLQYNFQWKPSASVVQKYIPEMISTFRMLGQVSKNAIGYGTFKAERENVLNRKQVIFRVRTKIVMDTSSSGLLSAILGVDALGLLPKYSNIWDLIPFSFAANWFTGVGENIRRAEYSLLLATIPAYYVHTYAISSPLTSFELDKLDLSSISDEPASLKVFYRDVSLYTPSPRDSDLGFGIPTKFPNLGVLGSLLYQLIFH